MLRFVSGRHRFVRVVVALALTMVGMGSAQAIYQNGGFEQNNFSGWTIGGGTNPALSGVAPFTGANVQISAGAPGPASIVGAVADARAPLLVLPRVGTYTAKINDEATGALLTTLKQTDTVTAADIDPTDHLPHLRFAFAPVLDDPAHSPQQQPYFYVVLRNVADNSVLFEQFAYSGQAGVTFLSGAGSWKYLQFQNVDAILPANAVGQQVELTVIAADCSLGGHGGYVYVDGFGSAPVGGGGGAPTTPTVVPALDRSTLVLLMVLMAGIGALAWRRSA
ncbi:MAG: hypothetical protein ABI411_08670 [Tahibacter sp.]